MLTNSHGGAVVTGDRDRYLGVVDFSAVTDFMRQQQEALENAGSGDVPAESNPEDEHVEEITADDGAPDERGRTRPRHRRPGDRSRRRPAARARRGRINAESAIVLFAIPVIVVVGFGAYAIWHATADPRLGRGRARWPGRRSGSRSGSTSGSPSSRPSSWS